MAGQVKEKETSRLKNTGRKIERFFREIKAELKKVIWPTKNQLINYTITVLLTSLAVGIIIWIADALLGSIIKATLTGY